MVDQWDAGRHQRPSICGFSPSHQPTLSHVLVVGTTTTAHTLTDYRLPSPAPEHNLWRHYVRKNDSKKSQLEHLPSPMKKDAKKPQRNSSAVHIVGHLGWVARLGPCYLEYKIITGQLFLHSLMCTPIPCFTEDMVHSAATLLQVTDCSRGLVSLVQFSTVSSVYVSSAQLG